MNTLPIPLPRTLSVACVPHAACEPLAQLAARLAARGPLTVLDGGNCFPAYRILRLVQACAPDPSAAMQRIFVRRAFTCYQMLALLESTPALSQPSLVLDPLATFYDEQVSLAETNRLLRLAITHLERLGRVAPLLVALTPSPVTGREFLIERICACADQVFWLDQPLPQVNQLELF